MDLIQQFGTQAFLIDDSSSMEKTWFDNVDSVGVTAGASAPEVLVKQVIEQLKSWGGSEVLENPGIEENIIFAVPVELR